MKVNIETQYACVENENLRGIPFYIINLINALLNRKRNDYSITFFDQYKERGNINYMLDYLGQETLHNIQVYECNDYRYSILHKDENAIYRTESYNSITGVDADVFHFPHYKPIPYALRGKMVVTIHDMTPVLPRAKYWFTESFVRNAARDLFESLKYLEQNPKHIIITDSIASKNDILNYSDISQEQVFVVSLAHESAIIDSGKSNAVLESMKINTPYLLYLGELDFRKGIVDILDAFQIIRPKFPELKLVLAGLLKPTTKIIHDKLHNYKFIDDVYLPGYVSNEQKQALLSSTEIFLFPSEYEGFGLPVLEAMAHGRPVITTNVSSLPEVGGDAVIYVSPNNPEQLAYEAERLLESESLRQNYSTRALLRSREFSWDKTAQMTEDVYRIAYERS